MDDKYLLAAVRYIELNPMRAGLAENPENYAWSNARAHFRGEKDMLAQFGRLRGISGDWQSFMREPLNIAEVSEITAHSFTGRPLGAPDFISVLERRLGRVLTKEKPGPGQVTIKYTVPK